MSYILITGGAGYIGTHICIELMSAGFDVVVFDNLSNASPIALKRVEQIVGKDIPYVIGDIRSRDALQGLFGRFDIVAVIHCAGLKSVGESVEKPLLYYDNNFTGTISLCEVMAEFGCKTLVFSSSATVYGDPESVPVKENVPLVATNPYGRSKLMVEDLLRDLFFADSAWSIGLLRYFNPVGAHESGLIGEAPAGRPNNLMPFISQVAVGQRERVFVFGNDYPTVDGTGVRDYIHVVDLAKGHVKALEKLLLQTGVVVANLGTGRGYSVLELIYAFRKCSGRKIPFEVVARRQGDAAQCYADPSYANQWLSWQAKLDIDRMCEDTWRWQERNPCGYES